MPYLAVEGDGSEHIFYYRPVREGGMWALDGPMHDYLDDSMELPKGFIEKHIGRKLTWDDDPVEF